MGIKRGSQQQDAENYIKMIFIVFYFSTGKNLALKRENTMEEHVVVLGEKVCKHKLQCRELLEACVNMRATLNKK